MKKIIFLVAAGMLLQMQALLSQTKWSGAYRVQLKMEHAPGMGCAYLIFYDYAQKKQVRDSCLLQRGKCVFKGIITVPAKAVLSISPAKANSCILFLQAGKIKVAAADSLSNAIISGSPVTDDYIAAMHSIDSTKDQLKESVLPALIKRYGSSPVGLYIIGKYFSTAFTDTMEIAPLYHLLSQEVQKLPLAKTLREGMDKVKRLGLMVGTLAPDFVQPGVDGKPVSLSSFRGKYVLLDFWASWCHPCREESPYLVKAFSQFKDSNFTIVSVSIDRLEDKDKWLAAIKKDGLTWTQLSELKYPGNEAAVLYNVIGIPQNFLINPEGKIIAADLRGEELITTLSNSLKLGTIQPSEPADR